MYTAKIERLQYEFVVNSIELGPKIMAKPTELGL